MDKPTTILSDEHKNILKAIDVLSKECAGLQAGKKIDKDLFSGLIDFIRGYADGFHHAKEEDILFVELCNNQEKMHCNPVEMMLYEHNLGRGFVKGMAEALQENNSEKLIENGRGYCELLKEHIFKEDNILFPMADEALPEQTQNLVLDKFKKAESKIGAKTKDQYLSFINKF